MKINFESGGAEVIDRIIEAYGFRTKLEYSNYLGTSSANMSSRYKKGFFPSDLVVRCMAETGATLEWLATGEGDFPPNKPKETVLSDDTLEKLERLAVLKEKGVITEQELIELKAKLI
ncbi:helix-turn-helix transcriptional regulator [Utexia brackfieldae]|uniref:helix-turn-helix transcriptional regulator n=1 Tax=Utexia brackfieldae TaxID=3074108 RepID=UPI00370D7124